jgi:hypothetical protein
MRHYFGENLAINMQHLFVRRFKGEDNETAGTFTAFFSVFGLCAGCPGVAFYFKAR